MSTLLNETQERLAATVVLYNPEQDVIDNIYSYLHQVEILYVIDNSPAVNESLVKELSKQRNIRYFKQEGNIGLAKALNIGAGLAVEDGYQWLLTMDQDSKACKDTLCNLWEYVAKNDSTNTAIVSPFHTDIKFPLPSSNDAESPLTVLTSGNLLNLNIFNKIGPFYEKLFIDSIDHDYCLKAQKKGYQVIQVNSAILDHQLGNQKLHFGRIISTHHNAFRRYYITRNRLYIVKKYGKDFPGFCFFLFREIFKDYIKIILFEDDKFAKTISVLKGFFHFRTL